MTKKYITVKISYDTANKEDLLKLQIIRALLNNGVLGTDLIYYNSLKNDLMIKQIHDRE